MRRQGGILFLKNPSKEEKAEELAFENDFFFKIYLCICLAVLGLACSTWGLQSLLWRMESSSLLQGLEPGPCIGIVESSPPTKSQKANFLKFPIRCYKKKGDL